MQDFKAHNIKEITCVLSGVPLHDVGGSGESWLELAPEGQITEDEISPDGQVTVCSTNDARLNIRITCKRTSGIMDRLSALMILMRETPNGGAFGPSVIRDVEGELLVNCAKTYLVTAGTVTIGKMAGEVTWHFRAADGISKSFFGGR